MAIALGRYSVYTSDMANAITTTNKGKAMSKITIKADNENNAELFWANLDEQFPGVAANLRRGETQVDSETWAEIQKLKGFSDGPSYASDALFEVTADLQMVL